MSRSRWNMYFYIAIGIICSSVQEVKWKLALRQRNAILNKTLISLPLQYKKHIQIVY